MALRYVPSAPLGACGIRGKLGENGLKMGTINCFVHPKSARITFPKTHFSPIFDPFLVLRWPISKAFWVFPWATRHRDIALANKLEGRLAQVPQLFKRSLLSTQGLAYFMEAVLNAAVRYQALHLPDPQHALSQARQGVTKAWAQHGGCPHLSPRKP